MRGDGFLVIGALLLPIWLPVLAFCAIADGYGYSKPWEYVNSKLSKLGVK